MAVMEQAKILIDNATYSLEAKNKTLRLVIEQRMQEGIRSLVGTFNSTLTRDGLPEFDKVSVRHENKDVPRWKLSTPEKINILQTIRKEMFESGNVYKNAHQVYSRLPMNGTYFNIEGHQNFFKSTYADDDMTLEINCGTGNNTYQRIYYGDFLFVDRTLFLIGRKYTSNDAFEQDAKQNFAGQEVKFHLCFGLNSIDRIYHTYK